MMAVLVLYRYSQISIDVVLCLGRVFVRLEISIKKGLGRSNWLTMKANFCPEMVAILSHRLCVLYLSSGGLSDDETILRELVVDNLHI